MKANIFYDFDYDMYGAKFENDNGTEGFGSTIEEAIEILRKQANKHDLWPKGDE